MIRTLAALAALLGLASLAHGQDMPLSQILIEGEGWRKVEPAPARPSVKEGRPSSVGFAVGDYWVTNLSAFTPDGKEHWITVPPRPLSPGRDFKPWHALVPGVAVHDGSGTLFVGPKEGRHVWIAPPVRRGTKPGEPDIAPAAFPYCALRVPHGKEMIAVTGLAADVDGRIYAATEIGVQVFDPTGRLCGVLAPAAPGTPELLALDGDQLTLWVGNTKYSRKLNATGTK